MKRMKHPQHGFHHAYDGNEEARMRSNGWVDDEPATEVEPDPVDEVAPAAPAAPRQSRLNKPGSIKK